MPEDGLRLGSQRTATPTAQRLLAVLPHKIYGAVFHALTLGYGAVISETAVFTKIFHGAVSGAAQGTGGIAMNDENTPKEKEVKRRFQSWLRPSTIKLMDRLYEDDNCRSRSEFIEKAIRFYAGYLSTQNAREYLPNVVISTLKSIVAESDNRQNRMMFKLAVEIAIMQNLVALQQDIDPLSLERLRGDCVKEVKRLNGSFSFEDALDWQKD